MEENFLWEPEKIISNFILHMKFYLCFHNACEIWNIFYILLTRDTCHIGQVLTEGYIRSLHCVVRSFQAKSFHFIVRSFHSFGVKRELLSTLFWLLGSKDKVYTWVTPLFLLMTLSSHYIVEQSYYFVGWSGLELSDHGIKWPDTLTDIQPSIVLWWSTCWPTRGWCRPTSQLICRPTPFFTAFISVYMFFKCGTLL